MTVASESLAESGGLYTSPLLEGLRVLSVNEEVQFTKYVKQVLPLDGYVFWLRGETICVTGSFHYAATREMREDETLATNRVVFTTGTPLDNLNISNPQILWVASHKEFKFSFSSQGMYYEQAKIYHYSGQAVHPAMASQLVDNLYSLSPSNAIVSNSLPVWLALQRYDPIWLGFTNPCIAAGGNSPLILYPSFSVPPNIEPPYGVVHIEPSQTKALQAFPYLNGRYSHSQLASDHVKVTLYGCNSDTAQDFVDLVNQYSFDTDNIGLMSMPIVKDEKRTQSEIAALAMKKTIDYDVSYLQTRVRDIARQLILDVIVQYTIQPL